MTNPDAIFPPPPCPCCGNPLQAVVYELDATAPEGSPVTVTWTCVNTRCANYADPDVALATVDEYQDGLDPEIRWPSP